MTFEEFQATRKDCDDLRAALRDARWDGEPPAQGFIYLDALYIEKVGDHWPPEVKALGKYALHIERRERISDDLQSLERDLYEFALSAGYSL